MSEEEKYVQVGCECEETLLDTWLPPVAVQCFLTRLAAAISSIFPDLSPQQVLTDISTDEVYRFVVPPFLAFVSLGSHGVQDPRDVWIDLDQFVRNRHEIPREAIEQQISAVHSSAYYSFFHSMDEVVDDLPVGKTTTIALNPKIPGDLDTDQIEGYEYAKVSVTQCFSDGVLSGNPLSFGIPPSPLGRFAVDKASASLLLSMKKALIGIGSQLRNPSICSLIHTEESISKLQASLGQLSGGPSPTVQVSLRQTDPLQEYRKSLESDVQDLQAMLSFVEESLPVESHYQESATVTEEPKMAPPQVLHLTMEKEDGLVVYLRNPTVFSYPELSLRLVNEQGDVLEQFKLNNVAPGWSEVILREGQIMEMVEKGGIVLQLDSFSLSIVGSKT